MTLNHGTLRLVEIWVYNCRGHLSFLKLWPSIPLPLLLWEESYLSKLIGSKVSPFSTEATESQIPLRLLCLLSPSLTDSYCMASLLDVATQELESSATEKRMKRQLRIPLQAEVSGSVRTPTELPNLTRPQMCPWVVISDSCLFSEPSSQVF